MKRSATVALALGIILAGPGPAAADPARTSSASAFGLEATGTLPISRTPEVAASQPPDSGRQRRAVLDIPAAPLAVSATLEVVAEAARDSRLDAALGNVDDGANARGFASTESLEVLLSNGPVTQTLLRARVLQAEAVGRCVNNQPVFDTGSRIVGLELAGAEIPVVDETVRQVLGRLAPNGPLSSLISVQENETGTLPGGGVFVNALRVRIPLLNEDIVVSHAEARVPAGCGVRVNVQPTGPVAPVKPAVSAPGGQLAFTGPALSFLPVGLGMGASGVALWQVLRRTRRRT